jgi:hypothetical protein
MRRLQPELRTRQEQTPTTPTWRAATQTTTDPSPRCPIRMDVSRLEPLTAPKPRPDLRPRRSRCPRRQRNRRTPRLLPLLQQRPGGRGSPKTASHSHPGSGFREGKAHAETWSGEPVGADAKRCTGCSAWLALEEFPVNRRMHLGRGSRCRECARAATRDWRERNRERVNAERREAYRQAHPLRERACVVCGELFVGRSDALVCGEECRRKRKAAQRRRNYPATRRSRTKAV